MNDDINIPLGLCDITYEGETYFNLASEAVFQAIPIYETFHYGKMRTGYLLTDYQVTFDFALSEESYNTLKLSSSLLHSDGVGMYDDPRWRIIEGKPLVIHPVSAGSNKEYDITMFNAIIDPEKPFERVYDKGLSMIQVRFIGQPSHQFSKDGFESYFYIGDTDKAGVQL